MVRMERGVSNRFTTLQLVEVWRGGKSAKVPSIISPASNVMCNVRWWTVAGTRILFMVPASSAQRKQFEWSEGLSV